jgi:hypothetical protein
MQRCSLAARRRGGARALLPAAEKALVWPLVADSVADRDCMLERLPVLQVRG